MGSAVGTLTSINTVWYLKINISLNLNLHIQTKCKNPKSEHFWKSWLCLFWSLDGNLLVLDTGKVVEPGPRDLESSSSKHTQDALVEEGHHEVIAVFTWKGGNLFNQPIFEP